MDVGRLERGLPVNISLDGFDALIYGKLEGQLKPTSLPVPG